MKHEAGEKNRARKTNRGRGRPQIEQTESSSYYQKPMRIIVVTWDDRSFVLKVEPTTLVQDLVPMIFEEGVHDQRLIYEGRRTGTS